MSPSGRSQKKLKRQIFIVEDEPIIAALLCDVIMDFGYEYVGPAYDLQGALSMVRKLDRQIDAALVDIMLGEKLAYELCHPLHARHVPFAFATGLKRDMIEAPWRKCRHVAKPFSRKDIAAVLALLLEQDQTLQPDLVAV